jgi:hypothetical protein
VSEGESSVEKVESLRMRTLTRTTPQFGTLRDCNYSGLDLVLPVPACREPGELVGVGEEAFAEAREHDPAREHTMSLVVPVVVILLVVAVVVHVGSG